MALSIKHGVIAMACALALHAAAAGPLRDFLAGRAVQDSSGPADDEDGASLARLPPEVQVVRDVPYGDDARQRYDVYLPRNGQQKAPGAPVIFMVHGGGWSRGDKAARAVVENKVARWVPAGFVVISANYRMLPDAAPLAQAQDVARALAAAQNQAATWGGDRRKFILMGHSAGAHLVALLAASPALAEQAGAARWLGAVLLDSAALDVAQLMQLPHLRLYDRAFGSDPAYWKAASPFDAMAGTTQPMLAVCSTRRRESCMQADQFIARAASFGTHASVLREDLSHREINVQLGEDGGYTQAVESFLRSLDVSVAKTLASPSLK